MSCSFFLRRAKGRGFFFFHGRLFYAEAIFCAFCFDSGIYLETEMEGRKETRTFDVQVLDLGLLRSSKVDGHW